MTGTVRRARPDDVPEILRLVRELATYEREPDAVHATEADLHEALFGPAPAVFAHVADAPDDIPDGGLDGMALWYLSFSSWEGRHGIHLLGIPSDVARGDTIIAPMPGTDATMLKEIDACVEAVLGVGVSTHPR